MDNKTKTILAFGIVAVAGIVLYKSLSTKKAFANAIGCKNENC